MATRLLGTLVAGRSPTGGRKRFCDARSMAIGVWLHDACASVGEPGAQYASLSTTPPCFGHCYCPCIASHLPPQKQNHNKKMPGPSFSGAPPRSAALRRAAQPASCAAGCLLRVAGELI